MKKITLIIIAIVILALLIWLGMNLFKIKSTEQINNPPENETSTETTPTAKELSIKETTENYEIDVKYPEIKGTLNTQSQIDANKLIKKITDEGVQGFKDDVEKNATRDFALKSTLKMSYEVLYLIDTAVSINFGISYYVAGMAHSTDYSSGFNYNLKDNKSIALENLFNQDSDFLSTLSTICAEDLKAQLTLGGYYEESIVEAGLEPKAENFAEFVFDKTNLIMIFNVYQVAPYVAGTQSVKIPYIKLAKINNNSELLKLINNK
jgi:hypothetical protein